jgi:hypothetical protein
MQGGRASSAAKHEFVKLVAAIGRWCANTVDRGGARRMIKGSDRSFPNLANSRSFRHLTVSDPFQIIADPTPESASYVSLVRRVQYEPVAAT